MAKTKPSRNKASTTTAHDQSQSSIPITHSRLFRVLVYILLALLIVLVGTQVSFLFQPIVVLVSTLFLPIFIAGILYYLFNPFVNLIDRIPVPSFPKKSTTINESAEPSDLPDTQTRTFPRTLGILLIFLTVGGLLTFALGTAIPVLRQQIEGLVQNIPNLVRATRELIENLNENSLILQIAPGIQDFSRDLPNRLGELLRTGYEAISDNVAGVLGLVTNLVVVLTTVPFVLFFMLKDGDKLPGYIGGFFPKPFQSEAQTIMKSMGDTLGTYIQGQLIVSTFVGVMVLIGYSAIGINYALLLAVVALVTNLIPYVGPVIGTVPGMVVALLDSPAKMIQVLVLVFIVQQVESQLVSPLVMGKKLKIHPLLIIFLLLTAGSLAGFLGLLLAVPGFAVARTAWTHIRQLWLLRREAIEATLDEMLEDVE
jgi:predicted PurR-regulated permease PerM